MPLEDEQRPIDVKIARQVLASIPPNWTSARVSAVRNALGNSRVSCMISLESKNNEPGVAFCSEELETVIHEFFNLHDKYNTDLKSFDFVLNQVDGRWKYSNECTYLS